MKRLLPLISALGFLACCVTLRAADGSPATILDTPIKDIQLNTLSAYAVIRVLGQAYAALRAGGGLKGIYNALVYGENAPKILLQDYRKELGLRPVEVTLATGETGITQGPSVSTLATAQKSPSS